MKSKLLFMITWLLLLSPGYLKGGEIRDLDYAQVIQVHAVQQQENFWRFDVTVRHNDEGWDHYADAWQVVNPSDGSLLGERVLAHPHDQEQPFTRSQSNIEIPRGVTVVQVRAKCNVHGFGGGEITVDLTREKGNGFTVSREHR